jgi:DNA-damage-inducible protein J
MVKTANLNIRIDPQTKQGAEQLYSTFGITISDAVNIFLRQSLLVGGLPFKMKQPRYNTETEAAIQEARDIISGKKKAKSYSSADELFEELDAEYKTESRPKRQVGKRC